MRMRIAAILLASFLLHCGQQDMAIVEDAFSEVSIDSLLAKAKKFKPEIGKQGGQIVLSSFSDPKSFNPITSTETSTSEFTAYMFEGLTRSNGVTADVEPHLADRWEISENGLVWTFHLRKDVKWFDGKPFSAYDVAFTFNELIFSKDIPNSARDVFTIGGKIIQTTAVDSHTVQFTLPVKFAPFLRSLSTEILPAHVYRPLVESKEFTSAMGADAKSEEIVGTGPFTLGEYRPSQSLTLVRNPNYWKKDGAGNNLPYLEKVVYVLVQDQNVELLKFTQGETDYLAFRGQDFPMLKRGEADGDYRVFRLGPNRGTSFLFLNQNEGLQKNGKPYVRPYKLAWFRNPIFRRAIAHCIDKESIIKIAMNGLGYPQHSPMSPAAGHFYNPDVPKHEYSIEKARALLDSIGFSDQDGDGILEDEDGNTVEFSLVTNSGNTVRRKIGEIINKDLKQLGFLVHFSQIEFNTLISKLDVSCDWEACILGLTGGIEPHFGANVWNSSGNLHMWYPRQKRPSTDWEARIDSLFENGVQELDPQKRKEYYDEWQVIVATELPLIYTALSERLMALRKTFGNINPAPYGGILHNLEEVFVKPSKAKK